MNSKLPLRLTSHFTLKEFLDSSYASAHCLSNVFPKEYEDLYFNRATSIACILENVRFNLQAPIFISSGFRTPEVNRGVGGVKNSRHTFMCAVDLKVSCPRYGNKLFSLLSSTHPRFLKYYSDKGYIHVDWPSLYLDSVEYSFDPDPDYFPFFN